MANLVRNTTKFNSSFLFKANDRDLLGAVGKQFPGLWFSWGIPGDLESKTRIYAVKFDNGKGEYTPIAAVTGTQFTIAPYLQNHQALFGSNQTAAQKALEAYFRKYANLDRLSEGRISPVDFVSEVAESALAAGFSQESVKGFANALMTPEALLYGKEVTTYYDLPSLRMELPASKPENSGSIDIEATSEEMAIDVTSSAIASPKEQKSLSVEQLIELDRSVLSKDSIVRILTEFGTEFDPKASKETLLTLLG
jgi:hypothetical protein